MNSISNKIYDNFSLPEVLYYGYLKVFTYPWFQLIITFGWTIFLTIKSINYQSLIDKSIWWTNLIIISFVYLIIELLIALAVYKKGRLNKFRNLQQQCLKGQIEINSLIANKLFTLSKRIKYCIKDNYKFQTKSFQDTMGFQGVSFYVCKNIHNIITSQLNCTKCDVNIYQQFESEKNYAKMVAYSNDIGPKDYHNKYYLHNNQKEKTKAPIVKIFERDDNNSIVLPSKALVQREFKCNTDVSQYIAIPIRSNQNITAFVLQINVFEKNVLGKNEEQMRQFICNAIDPYCMLLYHTYEQENILNMFYNICEGLIINKEGECVEG